MTNFLGYGSPEKLEAALTEGQGGEFAVYSVGLLYSSVCSSLPEEEVKSRMQRIPNGTRGGWVIADHEFAEGSPNPSPCNQKPDTHKHYLFTC